MLKTNLISILEKFDPKEIKEFSEFIRSPFFNKNFNVIKLYEYIKKQYPDFNGDKLDKIYVYKKLFNKGPYNDGFMRTTMFNLGKLAEEYLKYTNFKKNEAKEAICLLEELKIRKLDKVFLKNYDDAGKLLKSSNYKLDDYHLLKSEIDDLAEEFIYSTRYKNKNMQDFELDKFRNVVEHLTHFYLIKILNKYRFLLAKKAYVSVELDMKFIEHLIDYLRNNNTHYLNDPIIKLHLYEILLLKESKDEYYQILKKMLTEGQPTLDLDQRFSLHNILHIHCLKMTFKGARNYANERFELYKIALKQGIVKGSEDRYLDAILFGNILISALVLKQVNWAEEFVKKYSSEVSPENREGLNQYSHARIKFARGEFEQSLKMLNQIKSFNHIQYKIAIRDLMLINYYELSLFTQAYSFLDSHRHFLNKNKSYFSPERYERESNFMKLYAKILKLKEKLNRSEIDALAMEIQSTNSVIEWVWFTEKIEELKSMVSS